MFTELWKSLGGSFDKRWLLYAFGPALLFWGGGLWVGMQMWGLSEALHIWQNYTTETQFFYGVAGFLLVVLTALLLEAFEGAILRVYEGYWPWIQALADRRAAELREKRDQLRELRRKLVNGEITSKERARLGRLNAHLRHRPKNPERSMPTYLGDILRTAEDYPRERYGLDPIVIWPRIYPHLSETLREALGATQEHLDLALRLATLMLLYGIVWSLVVAFLGAWLVLTWTLPALLLAWLLWRSAHPAAISYAGLFRSAFDLHRGDIYEALRWPKPRTPREEVETGERLMLYLVDHVMPDEMSYTDFEKDKSDPAEPEFRSVIWSWLRGHRHNE
jgi:hypothetical protein